MKNAESLYRSSEELRKHISHWKLKGHEAGLLFVNDLLHGIVAPNEHLYLWKDAGELRLDRVSLDDSIDVDETTLFQINRAGANTSSRFDQKRAYDSNQTNC